MKLKMTLAMVTLALLAILTVSIASAQGVTLSAPTGIGVANGSEPGQVKVSWNAVDDAAFYRIGWVALPDYQATVAAERDWLEAFHFLDVANTGQTEWTLTRLSPGVQYYFIVASNNARNGTPRYGDWSERLTLTAVPQRGSVDYATQYPNCDAVRAHFPGGVKQGSPIYRPALDRDGDGTACEPAAVSVPSGDYLPIQSIGTFTGTGDNADNVIRLNAGLYRFTTTRNVAEGNLSVDVVEIADGDTRLVASIGRNENSDAKTLTIYDNDHGFLQQSGNYLLEVDTDGDWTVKVELIAAH